MDTSLDRPLGFDARTDTLAIAVVVATMLVSALCFGFIVDVGIVIAE
jgi:hypothetical protein